MHMIQLLATLVLEVLGLDLTLVIDANDDKY